MDSFLDLHFPNEACLPVKSLSELQSWECIRADKHVTSPLQMRASVTDLPKTLVCHDMKGGYLEDRFLYGSNTEDNYYFIHWSMVDIFVYFSHSLVSIPPCGWISAAHRNGVKILGTFITEWDAGAETCEKILSDIDSVQEICSQLVKISNFYQFDGWLINIENKLSAVKSVSVIRSRICVILVLDPKKSAITGPSKEWNTGKLVNQVPLLKEFVSILTTKMHESQKDSIVIWYDSVIMSGELKWQNELNELNRDFFDVCDGIYLNYNWDEKKLKRSVEAAGCRRTDVYVGVDVFGRGCPGGGGFSTDIAVIAARDFNLSVAIFAPGWVYECLDVKCFKENQYKFWNALTELCAPRVIESLPYYTSFCPGFGKKMFRMGKVISDQPWFNMGLQQPQPSFHYTQGSSDKSLLMYSEDAFNGGGCLQLTAKLSNIKKFAEFVILRTNFLINSACCISYTSKSFTINVNAGLILNVFDGKKGYDLRFDDRTDEENGSYQNLCLCCINDKRSILPTSTKTFMGVGDDKSWIKREYKVNCHPNKNCFVKSVSFYLSCDSIVDEEVSHLLGELVISPISDEVLFSYEDLNVMEADGGSVMIECTLQWTPDTSISFSDLFIMSNGVKSYICSTSQYCYKFKGKIVTTSEIEFLLCPNRSGEMGHPIVLKVPINCNQNSTC